MKKVRFYLVMLLALLLAIASLSGCDKANNGNTPEPCNSLFCSSWTTMIYGLGADMVICNAETRYNFFDGDSIWQDMEYKKLFSYRDEAHSTRYYEGLIREEEQKIFFVPAIPDHLDNIDKEFLLYDFSLTEGTTYKYISYDYSQLFINVFVKHVDYVNINGNELKRIQFSFSPSDDYICDTWIEGIGSVQHGFLYPFNNGMSGGIYQFLCCYQNETLVYHDDIFPDCYYDDPEVVRNILNSYYQQQ